MGRAKFLAFDQARQLRFEVSSASKAASHEHRGVGFGLGAPLVGLLRYLSQKMLGTVAIKEYGFCGISRFHRVRIFRIHKAYIKSGFGVVA